VGIYSFYSFTGIQQPTASGIDDFLYRKYSPVQGRWISPDPAGLGAVDLTNPQTWNRYAYVANNPLNAIDPLGLEWQIICTSSDGGPEDCTATWFTPEEDVDPGRQCPLEGCDPGGPGGPGGPHPPRDREPPFPPAANNGKGCNATGAVSFIHAHQADAATIANQLGVPVQNVLGLSGIESQWGTSNAALQANNFFGLHGGANAPFANGVWYTSPKSGPAVAMSKFPSYLASAQSFAAQYGSYVQGVTNPTAFAQALVKAGFNPGSAALGGNPNFVKDTAATINATAGRMQCP
jgi:RHS repeat-associated protein